MHLGSEEKHTLGLRKPTGFFPTLRRASLIRVIIDATTGDEADVPETKLKLPSTAKKFGVNT